MQNPNCCFLLMASDHCLTPLMEVHRVMICHLYHPSRFKRSFHFGHRAESKQTSLQEALDVFAISIPSAFSFVATFCELAPDQLHFLSSIFIFIHQNLSHDSFPSISCALGLLNESFENFLSLINNFLLEESREHFLMHWLSL